MLLQRHPWQRNVLYTTTVDIRIYNTNIFTLRLIASLSVDIDTLSVWLSSKQWRFPWRDARLIKRSMPIVWYSNAYSARNQMALRQYSCVCGYARAIAEQ